MAVTCTNLHSYNVIFTHVFYWLLKVNVLLHANAPQHQIIPLHLPHLTSQEDAAQRVGMVPYSRVPQWCLVVLGFEPTTS